MDYTIENSGKRVVVRGTIPVTDFAALTKHWSGEGLDTFASGVASALNATAAICAASDVDVWEKEIQNDASVRSKGDDELEWLLGTDTGISSRTIFSVLAKNSMLQVQALSAIKSFGPGTPSDPCDFGRCYRLLKLFPEWRSRLNEVATQYPKWTRLVENWDELTSLYEEELPSGKCPKLFDRMQELNRDLK